MDRDADGFLINTSDWSTEVMNQMAIEDGFEITDEIEKYLFENECNAATVACRNHMFIYPRATRCHA